MPALFGAEDRAHYRCPRWRRKGREEAGENVPKFKHYPLVAKTTENHAASTWPAPPLPVPRVTFTAMTRGPADAG